MSRQDALLTFGIGPVHEFIASARRVADVWAGSDLLSHLMGHAIRTAQAAGGKAIFPAADKGSELTGIPNRVVLRVPLKSAGEIAGSMGRAVEQEWTRLTGEAVRVLGRYGIEPADSIWSDNPGPGRPRQTDHVFDIAWSWVPEVPDYASASGAGALRYAASRLFRPFHQVEHHGEKCALCGIRTALPNGRRGDVRAAWEEAERRAKAESDETGDERFFRFDQGRLCLVCATKRLYTRSEDRRVYFRALDQFGEPAGDGTTRAKHRRSSRRSADEDRRRYVAVVTLDGDRMSEILALGPGEVTGDVEPFHRAVSTALRDFAQSLRTTGSGDALNDAQLNLDYLDLTSSASEENQPQLIYAGGDDVLVVCAPADALPVARRLRKRYVEHMRSRLAGFLEEGRLAKLTLSGAIVYAHSKHPAGLLFRQAHELLTRKAKGEAGRNALAIRLMKRSGVPVEVAFKWEAAGGGHEPEEPDWLAAVDGLVAALKAGPLSSRQTFHLRREDEVLLPVFGINLGRWVRWLADRISRGEATGAQALELAERIAPFFAHGKTEALRVIRFLAVELSGRAA